MSSHWFARSAAFVGNRPYADVRLVGSPGYQNTVTHKCLVDTGADYLQLPALAATAAGLDLSRATPRAVGTAGGMVMSLLFLKKVAVMVEGRRIEIAVLFDPTNTALPLAGRNAVLTPFNIGFDDQAWHWT
ncbi:hypothetical protein [Telluria beijingensis]|uniref:hypothetical protein n=1 Tax=Telluria beijingensis TaxID=3068633 RepID=UPI0027960D35|nr:hypothetical protein [Massilia sp. REN29]